eukprot:12329341-Karenia_brevis.AAC.1
METAAGQVFQSNAKVSIAQSLCMEKQCIKSRVSTQTAPALSSGEAESVSSVKARSTGFGMQSMAKDFGDEKKVIIHTD